MMAEAQAIVDAINIAKNHRSKSNRDSYGLQGISD